MPKPMNLDLTELERLACLLEKAGIPFEREDCRTAPDEWAEEAGTPYYFEHHEIYYPSAAEHISDAVISFGSYGHEDGLLEQMGLVPGSNDVDGWLKAQTVFDRWKEHFENAGGASPSPTEGGGTDDQNPTV